MIATTAPAPIRPVAPAMPASGMRPAADPEQTARAVDLAVWIVSTRPGTTNAAILANRAIRYACRGWGLMAIDAANAAMDAA